MQSNSIKITKEEIQSIAMDTHEFFPKYSWDWSNKIFISIFFWSHSSNPWKIREISKHFNWGFIRKLPIIRETSSMLESSLQESMQKWMRFQTICNLSLSILILKRYLQFTQWVPMGSHGFPIFEWVTHGRPMQSSEEIQLKILITKFHVNW